MKLRVIIIVLFIITAIYSMQSESRQDAYKHWSVMSSEQLLDKGNGFLERGQTDSAMVCYSIITSQETIAPKTDKVIVAKAYVARWRVFFYYFYDYGKSIESLDRAEQYGRDNEQIMAQIELNRGVTYHTIGIQCSDSAYMHKAFDCYKTALHHADCECADIIMSNAMELAFVNGLWSDIDTLWEEYQAMCAGAKSLLYGYNVMMHDGIDAMCSNEYSEAANIFERQIIAMNDAPDKLRYTLMAYINRAKALDRSGRYTEALACITTPEMLADSAGVKDAQLEIFLLKSGIYRHAGRDVEADDYNVKFLVLKGEILSYKQLCNITEQGFITQIQEVTDHLREANERQRLTFTIMCVAGGFTIAILFLLFLLYRKNVSLRHKNIKLYSNLQSLRAKSEEKYKNSTLNDSDKSELRRKIEAVMESGGEIYTCDFTARRLAELVGEPYKYVSQTINECYGCNFNAFVNSYRVREACRRMSDTHSWGNLTVEGIAHSVGFKARSSFINAFKSNTGLTPAEYLKLARQNDEKNA